MHPKYIEDNFPDKYTYDVGVSLNKYSFSKRVLSSCMTWIPNTTNNNVGTLTLELHCDDADDAAVQVELNEFVAKHITQNFLTKFWNWLTL
jgi:hypothetical protein